MKVLGICILLALASAAPKLSKLRFRELYKKDKTFESKPGPRIIGGHEATPHSLPYLAFLTSYDSSSGWYCTGALISQNYILTAAQCVQDAQQIDIVLGAHQPLNGEDSQIRLTSTEYKIHANYDPINIVNDIALIRLPKSVAFTVPIQSIPLPIDISNDYTGALSTVSGWGTTEDNVSSLSDVLNFGQLVVISNAECESFYDTLPSSNLCTYVTNKIAPCTGDNGAPLITDGFIIGLWSFASIRGCLDGPSGFTRITSFLDWIRTNSDV